METIVDSVFAVRPRSADRPQLKSWIDYARLEQMRAEQEVWSNRNFPNNQPYHPLLGLVEEVGELSQAAWQFAMKKRGLRVVPEDTFTKEVAAVKDAIADVMVYLVDYCTRAKISIKDICNCETPSGNAENISALVGEICHAHLKREQGIRGSAEEHQQAITQGLADLIYYLHWMCYAIHVKLMDVAWDTWKNEVEVRDWTKNTLEGM